jgi:hypothetical protein
MHVDAGLPPSLDQIEQSAAMMALATSNNNIVDSDARSQSPDAQQQPQSKVTFAAVAAAATAAKSLRCVLGSEEKIGRVAVMDVALSWSPTPRLVPCDSTLHHTHHNSKGEPTGRSGSATTTPLHRQQTLKGVMRTHTGWRGT